MSHLSENHHLRKHFLKNDQVPTLNVMKNKMGSFLADIYLKSMSPKVKNIVGLEPPMKGVKGGWYMPPEDLLLGKSVLKSVNREFLDQMSSICVENVGEKLRLTLHKSMQKEFERRMMESNIFWEKVRVEASREQRKETISNEKLNNSTQLKRILDEFITLHLTSISKIEKLFIEAATKEVTNLRTECLEKMKEKCCRLLEKQSAELDEQYEKQLNTEKLRLKAKFEENIKNEADETASKIHDVNVEKHVAVEKIRKFLECQKLACQIYVALNEQERFKEEESSVKREKLIKSLNDEIAIKDREIHLKLKKLLELQKLNTAWKKKVAHLFKTFQILVSYCLRTIPDHEEFFINLEILMLLHVANIYENPTAKSIFVEEVEPLDTPVSKPNPFYLVCDKDYEPNVHQDLCPKHCISSASEFPVIIINKRCIYAACHNFEQYPDKIKSYVDGEIGDDADFGDHHDYNRDIPVKYTSSQQLRDLNLESSLQQLLKQEIMDRNKEFRCKGCGIPNCSIQYCSCNGSVSSFDDLNKRNRKQSPLIPLRTETSSSQAAMVSSNGSLGEEFITHETDLEHETEVSRDNYMSYEEFKCDCPNKNDFLKRLPPYMKNISHSNLRALSKLYETCSLIDLKAIMDKASKSKKVPTPQSERLEKLDASTQYIDVELDLLCTCFSKHEMQPFLE